ncbi:hypothetical protein TNIN_197401 [Trichonephila inaurata madagascariensis]|uniref:Uncharacterized protein n=1 Tax=Trichonephila inaurata madagascariensis TaxID=2747483 RepID=A0A8X7CN30_9ARAC|nr:hypothetical protein TNIN_197401 [Trichonephila inaurata madagascariensis]
MTVKQFLGSRSYSNTCDDNEDDAESLITALSKHLCMTEDTFSGHSSRSSSRSSCLESARGIEKLSPPLRWVKVSHW